MILAILLVIFTTAVNCIGVKLMARINNVGVMVELVGASLLIIFLAFHIQRGPGVVMHTNGTGAGMKFGYFGAFLIASLVSATSSTGSTRPARWPRRPRTRARTHHRRSCGRSALPPSSAVC